MSADLHGNGPCVICGANPARGYASRWTAERGEEWFCHPDEGPSCYALDELLATSPCATCGDSRGECQGHVWCPSCRSGE